MTNSIKTWKHVLANADAVTILAWLSRKFRGRVTFASSMGAEDQVITDLIARSGLDIPIFTLDTGQLHPETRALIRRTEAHYGIRIRIYTPDAAAVDDMVREHGSRLYRKSVALRRRCCEIRKLHPLRHALKGKTAWICGLRREQAVTRQDVSRVEEDAMTGRIKINPLVDWSEKEVWRHLRANGVPYNPLHDRGFPSIGCACCTRAVKPCEDIRAGRWWWESPDHRECGLHVHKATASKPAGSVHAMS